MSPEAIQEQEIAARGIVRNIGYLPLGISQAASLVINESYTLVEFLEAYDAKDIIEDGEDVQLLTGDNTYRYSLGTVWTMNFERLGEDQQALLKTMSFLDPDRVPMSILKDGATKTTHPGLAFVNTARKIAKCKIVLLKSTLVSQSLDGKALKMHRLVQISCQLKMSLSERRAYFANGVALINSGSLFIYYLFMPVIPLAVSIRQPDLLTRPQFGMFLHEWLSGIHRSGPPSVLYCLMSRSYARTTSSPVLGESH